ncbi:MAG: TRAP transporter large permease subunit [Spirochaetes bacterium]|nr:TRAP transporter large permease subunit [Spirochaetota bacterium]
MAPETVGYFGFIVLFILMAIGLPIGVCMGIVGFGGLLLILPAQAAFLKMAVTPFDLVSSYTFATLPLFILMGEILFKTGQGANLYSIAKKGFGRVPGGLAIATIAGCAAFGAVSASAIATAVTMALVALPEMKKAKYQDALANGSLAAGGPIGSLIPPSGILIIYGIITENSIAQLFVAGIIPGILVGGSYVIMILIRCALNPKLGPPGEKVPIIEKIKSLSSVWEIGLLVIITMGGLIGGFFTATEAGGVGAFGALLCAAIRKKLSWTVIKEAMIGAMKTSGMIYGVLIGAMIFNYFCAASNLPGHLSNWVAGFALPPMGIMIIIVIIYLIMGALMDEASIQLLTLPIFYPLVMSLGFDPIWFGVIQCKLLNIGMIAPPVGITVFIIAGLDKTVPMTTVYRGVMWFILCDMITMTLFMAFPQIILWLPNILK